MRTQPLASGAAEGALALLQDAAASAPGRNTAAILAELQSTMWDDVGPFRTEQKLTRALARIAELASALGDRPPGGRVFDLERLEWLDLRNMLLVARIVAETALRRTESRGAHQRDDFPGLVPEWEVNQVVELHRGAVRIKRTRPAVPEAAQ